MNDSRNQNQIDVLNITYSILTYQATDQEVDLVALTEGICQKEYADIDVFVKLLMVQILKHQAEIEALVESHLHQWKWKRLNRVAQAIFLMSVAHFSYYGEAVDKSVIIDIAVTLAKRFLDEKDYKYINAVLDRVLE